MLDKYDVELLGTPLEAIQKAEDRELFRDTDARDRRAGAGELRSCDTVEEREATSPQTSACPLIVRPAYTLGGTGGGIAHNDEELLRDRLRAASSCRMMQPGADRALR